MSRKIVSSHLSSLQSKNGRQNDGSKTSLRRVKQTRVVSGRKQVRSKKDTVNHQETQSQKSGVAGRDNHVTKAAGKNVVSERKARRLPHHDRQPRSLASSKGRASLGANAKSNRHTSLASTHSDSGAFVDARRLESNENLYNTVAKSNSRGVGVFVKPKVIDFTVRRKEQKKAYLRGLLNRGILIASIVVTLVVIVWLICFSPALVLDSHNVEVSGGNEWVSNQEILRIVEKEEGKSLLLISSSQIESQMSRLPGVSNAKVTKHFPHGITATFSAQKPAAILKAADGKIAAVDSQGDVLNTISELPSGIPVIEVDAVEAGKQDRGVQQATKILSQLPEPMRQRISKVTAKTQDSITTELDQGHHAVIWGDVSDLNLKVAVVDKIINDPTKIGDKRQVDVSAPMRPIIK